MEGLNSSCVPSDKWWAIERERDEQISGVSKQKATETNQISDKEHLQMDLLQIKCAFLKPWYLYQWTVGNSTSAGSGKCLHWLSKRAEFELKWGKNKAM